MGGGAGSADIETGRIWSLDPYRSTASGEFSRLTRLLMRWSERVYSGSPVALTAVLLLIVGLVTAADWVTGPGLSFMLPYTALVAGAVWVAPVRVAATCAMLASVGSGFVAAAHPDSTTSVLVATVNAGLRLALLLAIAIGVVLLRRTMAELSAAARRDPLTGLLNRRAVFEMAEHERARALRSGRPMAIAYLDLDGLKTINDTDGHDAGDDLISRFASALRAATRESDLVGRLGGDEFIVVMPDTGYAEGVKAIDRLLSDEQVPKASCGIVTSDRAELTVEKLIAAADELMYEAKSNGGGVRTRDASPESSTTP